MFKTTAPPAIMIDIFNLRFRCLTLILNPCLFSSRNAMTVFFTPSLKQISINPLVQRSRHLSQKGFGQSVSSNLLFAQYNNLCEQNIKLSEKDDNSCKRDIICCPNKRQDKKFSERDINLCEQGIFLCGQDMILWEQNIILFGQLKKLNQPIHSRVPYLIVLRKTNIFQQCINGISCY